MKENTTFLINNCCGCIHKLYVREMFDKYFLFKEHLAKGGKVVEEKFVFDYQKFERGFV